MSSVLFIVIISATGILSFQAIWKKTPDVYSYLSNGIRLISDYGKTHHSQKDEVNAGIDKLLDHVDLESIRNDRMQAVQCITTETRNLYAKTAQQTKEAQEKASEVKKALNISMNSPYLY